MRYIEFEKIVQAVESLCVSAAHKLPDDVLCALKDAAGKESNPQAAGILNQLIENAQVADSELIPLCQDTGLAIVFVEHGAEVAVRPHANNKDVILSDAINLGIKQGYEKGYLRKSVVAEPLNKRINTGTNTPAIIHYSIVPGDKLKLTLMAKGGGCENKSRFRMFNPTVNKEQIIEWVIEVVKDAGADACPPFIIGVGLGGDFELSCLLSKKALLRNLNQKNSDKFYAELEREMFSRINALGLGPQGSGGDTTALAVLLETAPCHIASLPAAVNIECHSHRHASVVV